MLINLLLFNSYLLRGISLLCICFIVVPFTYSLVVIACVVIIFFTLLSFYFIKSIKSQVSKKKKENKLKEIHKRNQKSVYLSLFALGASLVLYFVLQFHTTLCLIAPLDKEFEPVRDGFRKILEK